MKRGERGRKKIPERGSSGSILNWKKNNNNNHNHNDVNNQPGRLQIPKKTTNDTKQQKPTPKQ